VTCIPYVACGICVACRSGRPNCCVSLQVFGVHTDGGMCTFLSVPSSALVHGNGLSYDELALAEPLAVSAHGVRRAAIRPDEFVLVVGAGPIGLGAMEFARLAGGRVIAMDINNNRLRFCEQHVHVHYIINPARGNALLRLNEITGGEMPTVIIDATGSQQAINGSLQYLAHGGRFILIGLQKEAIIFSHPEFHKRETTLMSSRNALREDFMQVIHALKTGLITADAWITHRTDFTSLKDEFPKWLNPGEGVIKAMATLD
jgi:2-desacetyl-2-hydroxyethyl bacteriochlorophyllide A dehydrogenase